MRNLKKTLTLLLTLALLIGSMSGMAFAIDPAVLTVSILDSEGDQIAEKVYTRAELEALKLKDGSGNDLKVKFSSLDKLPAWRTTVATGISLDTLINNAGANASYTFGAGDGITFQDTVSSKPGSFITTYNYLHDTNRKYFSNLDVAWEQTVLDANGKVVTPGYLKSGVTLTGNTVSPMLALSYYQARHLSDTASNSVTLSPDTTPMLCFGLKANELSTFSYTNNNFLKNINIITVTDN